MAPILKKIGCKNLRITSKFRGEKNKVLNLEVIQVSNWQSCKQLVRFTQNLFIRTNMKST